ncbi:YkvA family protein [Pelotomaculum propionicicum]|uniref:YkvA family protein n=1 Tax=Pelotomaculum propionicicum TaxID=258475 RepID=UPI003B7CA650
MKSDIFILYFAVKDPRVPRQAKLSAVLLAAYIISPIDIIPDFVLPGLGYIDDIVLIPFAAQLIQKMIPINVISDLNTEAVHLRRRTKSLIAVLVSAGIILALLLVYRYLPISF